MLTRVLIAHAADSSQSHRARSSPASLLFPFFPTCASLPIQDHPDDQHQLEQRKQEQAGRLHRERNAPKLPSQPKAQQTSHNSSPTDPHQNPPQVRPENDQHPLRRNLRLTQQQGHQGHPIGHQHQAPQSTAPAPSPSTYSNQPSKIVRADCVDAGRSGPTAPTSAGSTSSPDSSPPTRSIAKTPTPTVSPIAGNKINSATSPPSPDIPPSLTTTKRTATLNTPPRSPTPTPDFGPQADKLPVFAPLSRPRLRFPTGYPKAPDVTHGY